MKEKKRLLIVFLIIIIITIVIFIYIKNKENNVTFYLKGEQSIIVEYGIKYDDLGFVAKDGYGNDLSNNVSVKEDVNTLAQGTYKIDYELNYKGEKYYLYRIVTVREVKTDDLIIVFDNNNYVLKDTQFEDSDAYIMNTLTNRKFEYGTLSSTGYVDTSRVGTYDIIYTFSYNGGVITSTRTITVIDIAYYLSPKEMTQNKVKITLDLDNINDYLKTILPDGSIIMSKNIDYEVNSNGTYTFTIILKNGQEFKKNIEVDNIIGNYTCTGEITSTGTRITVSPTSDIKEYEWIIKNEIVKGTNSFSKEKIISEAKVNLVFSNNKKYQINCNITDKLVYHFKYDENNTKPLMKCNTYTLIDKQRLDAELKQVVEEAGYGTRAGVVAAARFLVGGLDYKVPYHGSSKYNREGLNIGQKDAWGCGSSGLDCYYFVYWARSQNGLSLDALYAGKHNKLADDLNNVKVGDYLLAPCTSSTCKNIYKINHVALVIGIDERYIYIAEETTGNINALVVTKVDKQNLPKTSGLSLVKHVDYPSEGNVTNMWMSE